MSLDGTVRSIVGIVECWIWDSRKITHSRKASLLLVTEPMKCGTSAVLGLFDFDGREWISRTARTSVLHRIWRKRAQLSIFCAVFLFETPINWYAQENRWSMTPAYTASRLSLAATDRTFFGKPFRMAESLANDVTAQEKHIATATD